MAQNKYYFKNEKFETIKTTLKIEYKKLFQNIQEGYIVLNFAE